MKTYAELTPEQQATARNHFLTEALRLTCEEGFVSWLPEDEQTKIVDAQKEMQRQRTPWFLAERVYEKSKDFYDAVALDDASRAVYATRHDPAVVRGLF